MAGDLFLETKGIKYLGIVCERSDTLNIQVVVGFGNFESAEKWQDEDKVSRRIYRVMLNTGSEDLLLQLKRKY
jgi:hypothetical protein